MTTEGRKTQFAQLVLPHLGNFANEQVAEYLHKNQYLEVPASTKYHGAWPGGWFDHSLCVMRQLVILTERNGLTWQRAESPYIVGFFHDICKLDQYVKVREEDGKPVYAWSNNTLFRGHGDKSLVVLASLGQLTEEEAACIRYRMGAFTDKEQWNDYTRAVHQYPNVLWTHTADMIVSHIYDK